MGVKVTGEKETPEKTILIVDDTELNRDILSIIFSVDYQIEFAKNGREALEIIREKDPNLVAVLLDQQMPEMTGLEFLQQVRQEGLLKKVPVFLITASDSDTLAQQAFELGVIDFIKRPISAYVVLRRVQSIIELYDTRQKMNDLLKKQEEQIKELVSGLIGSFSTILTFQFGPKELHARRLRAITAALLEDTPVSEEIGLKDIDEIIQAAILQDKGKIISLWPKLREPAEATLDDNGNAKEIATVSLLENLPSGIDLPIIKYAHDVFANYREKTEQDQGSGKEDENELPIWVQLLSLAELFDYLATQQAAQGEPDLNAIKDRILNNEFGSFNPQLMESFVQNFGKIQTLYQPKKGD